MNRLLIRYRHWLLGITLAFAIVCAILAFRVHINTDMSEYLPDDSNMRAGLEILTDEFGDMAEMGGSVRILCSDLSDEERVSFINNLRKMEEVNNVIEQENGNHTLYELGVSNDVDQVAFGKEIAEQYPCVEAVETMQDGAAAEAPMLLGGIALLLIILFAMCPTWLGPVLFLTSTGIAVLINTGTNAFLPSVSVTTNSIVSILQLVLSIDYSIILINRFRQERLIANDSLTAMQNAIKKAAAPIISSALTTIVGLLVLVFMKLKIGADLGIVISKGVLCSLICNFTVLPALILLFEKAIDRSEKPVLKLPTDKLAAFSMRFRIPLTLLFFTIFVGSFILRSQTNIIFLNAKPSKIEQYFPKKNPVVLIYDNADENKVIGLLDSIQRDNGVEMVLSYPTLLQREYTAPQMVRAIGDLSGIMAGIKPDEMPNVSMDMLSDDVMKVVYYAAHDGGRDLTMGFNEMADFILQQANNPNSLIAKQMDDNLKAQLKMLEEIRNPIKKGKKVSPPTTTKPVTTTDDITNKERGRSDDKITTETTKDPVRTEVVKELPQKIYSPYTDTALLQEPMTYSEMAAFLTMDSEQAKYVYKLAKRSDTTMTPLEFVHFVTEKILGRKMLAMMIKEEQKVQLLALQSTMDSTMRAATEPVGQPIASTPSAPTPPTTSDDTPTPIAPTKRDSVAPPIQIETEQIEDELDVLDEMLNGNKRYTAHQMTQNLSVLGEEIPEALVNLLYLYYGGNNYYDNSWTLSLEQMINFLVDSVLTDPRFDSFIEEEMRAGFAGMQQTLADGVGKLKSDKHSIAMIITGYSTESPETYQFIDYYNALCNKELKQDHYSIGESIMLSEMKAGFSSEMTVVTLLTIAAIFLIVALTFRSILLSTILVMTVMSGVFINVTVSGIGGGSLLYLAYLIVQSILMGAAIDYGILFANYYRETRATLEVRDALKVTYRNTIQTILTSGLILILVPGIMAVLVSDPTIADIVRSISIGALAAVLMILFVLPGVLATFDKVIVRKRKE